MLSRHSSYHQSGTATWGTKSSYTPGRPQKQVYTSGRPQTRVHSGKATNLCTLLVGHKPVYTPGRPQTFVHSRKPHKPQVFNKIHFHHKLKGNYGVSNLETKKLLQKSFF